MPDVLPFNEIDRETQRAILDYINRAPGPDYFSGQWRPLVPPANPGRRGKAAPSPANPDPVAAGILRLRDELPGRQLDDLERLKTVPGFDRQRWQALKQLLGDYTRQRNRAELFVDGRANLQIILDVIDSAQNYLHLIPFLFFNDEAGQAIAAALAAKARQGVEVRVLLDRRSSQNRLMDGRELRRHPTRYNIKSLEQRLAEAGVRVIDPQPLERPQSELDWLRQNGVPEEWIKEQEEMNTAIWTTLASWNHVDHRKIMIADGRRGLVMSCCIGNEYQYPADTPAPGNGHDQPPRWHDAVTLLEGGAVLLLNRHFAKRWMLSGGDIFPVDDPFYSPAPEPAGSDTVTIVDSYPGRVLESWIDRLMGNYRQENELRHLYAYGLIDLAKKEVWVQNPYVLDRHVMETWEKRVKARPDVQFNLIRPHPTVSSYPGSNIPGVRDFLKQLFRRGDTRLIKRGARIFEYVRAASHIKIALVDDWLASHGSYNLNFRSAKKDIELNVIVESRSYARQVRRDVFDVDLAYCRTVSPTRTESAIGTGLLAAGDLSILDMILPEVG